VIIIIIIIIKCLAAKVTYVIKFAFFIIGLTPNVITVYQLMSNSL